MLTCGAAPPPVVGTICAPANDSRKHPAMILLGGSECGDLLKRIAVTFAEHGYVAVSVQYCGGVKKTPLIDVPVETVGAALAMLEKRAGVDARHIGILGGSKGGEFALLAASTYPQIVAVVADVPSPYGFMGLDLNDQVSGCSWSRDGKALPCIAPDPAAAQQIGMAFGLGKPVVLRSLYDASVAADPAQVRAATFALENINGPVLCLAGADDQVWNSRAQCGDAMAYLHAHQHHFADREIVYPNAGHTFLWATRGVKSAITSYKAGGVTMEFGGTPEGDVAASSAAWTTIWAFLGKALGG